MARFAPLWNLYTPIVYKTNERPLIPTWHCDCYGDCRNSKNCSCRTYQTDKIRDLSHFQDLGDAVRNFEGFAYTSTRRSMHSSAKQPENVDLEARVVKSIFIENSLPIFECNSLCGCGPDCLNRTVGRGRREKLSIEKTISRGWGVFSEVPIPSGRLVAHYAGELITDAMSHDRGKRLYSKIGRTYVFDLDPWWTKSVCGRHSLETDGFIVLSQSRPAASEPKIMTRSDMASSKGRKGSKGKQKKQKIEAEAEDEDAQCVYSVDAFFYGNISRFINHSCRANTAILPIYIDDDDPMRPIFAMFANKPIQRGKEITTSYSGPEHDEVPLSAADEEEDSRRVPCRCGASNCKGFMFS